jgi:hypothetical protein
MHTLRVVLAVGVIGAGLIAACGSDSGPAGAGASSSGTSGGLGGNDDGGLDPNAQPLVISPADPVLTFITGQPAPTAQLVATTTDGVQVPAVFSIDRGELGTMTTGGLFTASGNVGGKGKVTATWNGRSGTTSLTVNVKVRQNGRADSEPGGGGAGGYGGVGGEGPGAAVDPATIDVLTGAVLPENGLSLLYPYTDTVWPRGVLAPLLQWAPGAKGDYDAVYIKLTEASYEYEGFFAKTKTPFTHHPIPQAAWKQLLSSNAGEEVNVTLVFAKGGQAYGPITTKWKVSSAPLKGTVYYNSYGTKLAKNFVGAIGGDGKFGGATLAIQGNSTEPKLIAGGNGDASYCRVCHSVAANGSVLITQRNDGASKHFSTYELNALTETKMSPEGASANFAWPAIYPDGSLFMGDSSSASGSSSAPNELFQVVSGGGAAAKTPAKIATSGWPNGFRAGFPTFAPDGKSLAFTMFGGVAGADQRTLGMIAFDKATSTFSGLTPLYTPPNAAHTALFPSFLPTSTGIVFELETRANARSTHFGETRADVDGGTVGARGELWWIDMNTKTPHRLDRLNGVGYLPSRADTGHTDDATLNYEPTVNPVPSGGYAWVVFTSRRLYGDVATINPYNSDPRATDLTVTPTPKKLWVAAIDLNAPPGTDPSHPAFYLPAQELLAGNSRGYWVVDPCQSDGASCETGDECCGGFCRPDNAGKLVCSTHVPTCAQEFEKCTTSADCCSGLSLQCINGRCATNGPK